MPDPWQCPSPCDSPTPAVLTVESMLRVSWCASAFALVKDAPTGKAMFQRPRVAASSLAQATNRRIRTRESHRGKRLAARGRSRQPRPSEIRQARFRSTASGDSIPGLTPPQRNRLKINARTIAPTRPAIKTHRLVGVFKIIPPPRAFSAG